MASGDNLNSGDCVSDKNEKSDGSSNEDNENDLSDLLDSALNDFDKYSNGAKKPSNTNKESTKSLQKDNKSKAEASYNEDIKPEKITEDQVFNQIYDELFKNICNSDPNIANSFGKTNEPLLPTNVNETLQKALGSLNQNLQDLQNENLNESEMMDLLSQMNMNDDSIDDGANGIDDMFPMVQNMMKNLLSKELLYPSLKTLSTQYPTWLTENEQKLSRDDYNRYKEQHKLMTEIVLEFESERGDDKEDVKSCRMNKILDSMQKMQSLGNPPQDIVGEMPKNLDFDELNFSKFSESLPDPSQCLIS